MYRLDISHAFFLIFFFRSTFQMDCGVPNSKATSGSPEFEGSCSSTYPIRRAGYVFEHVEFAPLHRPFNHIGQGMHCICHLHLLPQKLQIEVKLIILVLGSKGLIACYGSTLNETHVQLHVVIAAYTASHLKNSRRTRRRRPSNCCLFSSKNTFRFCRWQCEEGEPLQIISSIFRCPRDPSCRLRWMFRRSCSAFKQRGWYVHSSCHVSLSQVPTGH
jgi:hypothetical protein